MATGFCTISAESWAAGLWFCFLFDEHLRSGKPQCLTLLTGSGDSCRYSETLVQLRRPMPLIPQFWSFMAPLLPFFLSSLFFFSFLFLWFLFTQGTVRVSLSHVCCRSRARVPSPGQVCPRGTCGISGDAGCHTSGGGGMLLVSRRQRPGVPSNI